MIVYRFSTDYSIVSASIRWFTNSDFSHVEMFFPLNTIPSYLQHKAPNGGYVGAHIAGGVDLRPINYDKALKREEFRVLDVPPETEQKIRTAIISQLGKPYDILDILGLVTRENWHEQGKWICSALQFWGILQGGLKPLATWLYTRITPRDLWLSPLLKPLPSNSGLYSL